MHAKLQNYKYIIAIIFLLKASLSWGFSVSRTGQYIQKALDQKLYSDPQWIKLNHYEKKWTGGYQSPFTVGLFLDSDGHQDPEAELKTTIEALFSQSDVLQKSLKMHPQCYYLARTKWIVRKLNIQSEDILPCEERQLWKKNLNVSKVSVIFASSDLGNASSSFGHTFLKLINLENSKNKDLIDYGVDYAADADASEGLLYAVKGLVGKYKGRFTMLPYHQKIREYLNVDGRDIWEYELNFTDEEVSFLLDHLLEMEKARANYYFFDDNCSYRILKSLEVIRPEANLSDEFKYFVIPIDTVKKILRQTNWIKDIKFKKSLKNDYLESVEQLNQKQIIELKSLLAENSQNDISFKDFELKNTDRAQILEAAQKFYAFKSFSTGQDYDKQLYPLFIARAQLGDVVGQTILKKPEEPHLSHDSSSLSLKVTHLESKENKYTLKFKNALHEVVQDDFGTVPFSHNEMASIEFSYFDEKSKIEFDQITLLKLLNINPSNILENKFSWKINLAVKNDWNALLEGGAGASFNVLSDRRLTIGSFLTAYYEKFDFDQEYKALGPELMFLSKMDHGIMVYFNGGYFLLDQKKDSYRLNLEVGKQMGQNFDLQFGTLRSIDERSEQYIKLNYNFIL